MGKFARPMRSRTRTRYDVQVVSRFRRKLYASATAKEPQDNKKGGSGCPLSRTYSFMNSTPKRAALAAIGTIHDYQSHRDELVRPLHFNPSRVSSSRIQGQKVCFKTGER
jgi:hypothetical protein